MKSTPVLGAVLMAGLFGAGSASAASIVTAPQGGVARWDGIAASECGVYGKRYPAVDAVCYYPVDIRTEIGAHEIALWDQDGKQHLGSLRVEAAQFPSVDMQLAESLDRYMHPSADEIERARSERAELDTFLGGTTAPAMFSLPLGEPAASLPASSDDFGSERLFNNEKKSLHSGRDYPVSQGSSVKAVADGTVTLAADHFYTGNAVYIDHGAGLISMNFHLQSLDVKTGDTVKRGQTLGKVGATGRATGPHLHIGLRWLGKRIDPALLFASTNALPSVTDSSEVAQTKIDKAEQKEPDESTETLDSEP